MVFFRSLCFVSLLLLQVNVYAAVEVAQEYDIKAAFLMNLGNFVYWPDSAFSSAESAFNVCTLGDEDPFAGALEFMLQTYTNIKNHPLTVTHVQMLQETFDCHLLFINKSEAANLNTIFQTLQNKPILLVGDTEQFVLQGGMVEFFRRANKIRLLVDPEAFAKAGLKPSANLMQVAETFQP